MARTYTALQVSHTAQLALAQTASILATTIFLTMARRLMLLLVQYTTLTLTPITTLPQTPSAGRPTQVSMVPDRLPSALRTTETRQQALTPLIWPIKLIPELILIEMEATCTEPTVTQRLATPPD